MQINTKKRVGILRGGDGEHYESSLQKGGDVIAHIFENLPHRYKVFDILIDKKDVWHLNGVPILPTNLIHKVDVVWNMSHPGLAVVLDNLSIPNISVSSFSSALENSKEMLREHMKKSSVLMPRHIILPVYQKDFDGPLELYAVKKAKEIHQKFSSPWLVQSLTPNCGMGIHLAKTFPELIKAITDGVEHKQSILVEEFIVGKVATVHSLPSFRHEPIYVFPPTNVFGQLSLNEKAKLISLTRDLHQHIDAQHYLKSNFVLDKRGKAYLTDIALTPSLKPESYFSQSCESVGAQMHQVIEHILERAM